MTDAYFRIQPSLKDPEALLRIVARAVIRRVEAENPGAHGCDLRVRLSAANPFGSDEYIGIIWQEEISWALRSRNYNLN